MFWVAVLVISILLYILLDGFDLGIGILFVLTGSEERRRAMMSAVAPIWDGNETWLVAGSRIHPRPDGWGLGRGAADHQRLLHWWELRLVQSVCAAVRRWPVSRLYAAGRRLAGQEMRSRNPRFGASPNPLPGGWPVRFSDRRFRLCSRRAPAGRRFVARAPVFFRLPGGPRDCRPGGVAPRSSPSGQCALLHGCAVILSRLW